MTREIVFSITGAASIDGGIASSNHNNILALMDLSREIGYGLRILSFLESDCDRPDYLSDGVYFEGFNGNKLNFIISLFKKSLTNHGLYVFDHVNLANAALPFVLTGIIKSVVFAHGSESWKNMKFLSNYSFSHAALFLTNSDYTLNKMQDNLSIKNGKSCLLGLSPLFDLNKTLDTTEDVDKILLESADGVERCPEKYFLHVSRMHPSEREKGHLELLEILPELISEYGDINIVFAGEGEDRINLIQRAREKGLGANIFFPGFVEFELLKRLYKNSYAYVMPSTQEGFGLVYLEAMNYGKACVGCTDQGAEDIIINNKTGYLINNPRDKSEMINKLGKLLSDPEKTKKMGIEGFKLLNDKFSSEAAQERIKKSIDSIL